MPRLLFAVTLIVPVTVALTVAVALPTFARFALAARPVTVITAVESVAAAIV